MEYSILDATTLGAIIAHSRYATLINNEEIVRRSQQRKIIYTCRLRNLDEHVGRFQKLCTKEDKKVSNASLRNTEASGHYSTEAKSNNTKV